RPTAITVLETETTTSTGVTTVLLNQKHELLYDPNHPEYNDWGIPPEVDTTTTTSAGDDVLKVIPGAPVNLPDNWLLGLQTSQTVTSTTAFGEESTRTTNFTPDQDHGDSSDVTIEPD